MDWELEHKESWAPKNWCFGIVVLEKILESSLDCKEIKPVNPKGNQTWMFIYWCWSSSTLAPNPSQHQGLFQWVNSSHQLAKDWSFSFSIIPSKEIPGLISFRMDWLDLLAVQGTLKSLLQYHSSGYQFQYSCLENPIDRGAWWLQSMVLQRIGHGWVNNSVKNIHCKLTKGWS